MATWFLIVIYLAFISLGIPDALLGSAWPVMHPQIGASLESAGLLSMIIAAGTIVSSLASGTIIKKWGTGQLTLFSCALTASALLGFSFAPSLLWLALLAIPLGLGAGAVDAALNHYVANHYKAHHMSWLHCFWGVGAMTGPIIMSYFIAKHGSWREGYSTVSMIQWGLVLILLVTLPLWKKVANLQQSKVDHNDLSDPSSEPTNDTSTEVNSKKVHPIRIKGVKMTLIAFLFYCGVESTVGLWGASYLVGAKSMTAETAALWVSLYYGGITVGRLITGFITMRVNNRILILAGQIIAVSGVVLMLLPLPNIASMIGLILIGVGFAPVYPGLIHETPHRFGKVNSAQLIGYQMAVAYTGTTFLPPLFGVLASQWSIHLFPIVVLIFIVGMLLSSESVNVALKKRQSNHY